MEEKWEPGVVLSFHNPFEKQVRINRVHVQIPAHGGRAAVDRMYELRDFSCEPLADKINILDTEDLDWHMIVPAKEGEVSSASPFGEPPGASAPKGVCGSVTPVQVMMMP